MDKLTCEDCAAAGWYGDYVEAMAPVVEVGPAFCANCGGEMDPQAGSFCSDLCRDEADGMVDWNAAEA